jgi:kinesin family protein 2/24
VCVRKRIVFPKEVANGEIDCLSICNPQVRVHECKLKVDGITKYIENSDFTFDNAFDETKTSDDVYKYMVRPLLDLLFNDGTVTCFAYG